MSELIPQLHESLKLLPTMITIIDCERRSKDLREQLKRKSKVVQQSIRFVPVLDFPYLNEVLCFVDEVTLASSKLYFIAFLCVTDQSSHNEHHSFDKNHECASMSSLPEP